jgi:uncharacterized protein DUF6929
MQKFHLELLVQLIGIGSASGLLFKDHSVYVISDNGSYLYEYGLETKILDKIKLMDGDVTENIPKKIKPDFEALAEYGDTIYVFGSGSTPNRNKMVTLDRKSRKVLATTDLADLYLMMQSFGKIKPTDFNIEGVAYDGQTWYFFQRGNAGTGKNGIFSVKAKDFESDFSVLYNEFKLPKIKGIRTSFTDAVFVGADIYFLATAENTASTYDDGAILGSIVGKINPGKMKIEFTRQISSSHKFEGITLFGRSNNEISFLLSEDNDTDVLESGIYKVTLPL